MELRSTLVSVPDSLAGQSRRKNERYRFTGSVDWDFYTDGLGIKTGYIENISEGGCLLRASDAVDHRRWLRMAVKEKTSNLATVIVGRIVRREDRMETWENRDITLYRYGVEFIRPLNTEFLNRTREPHARCSVCGDPSATIPDFVETGVIYCVLCHLRRACHNLLAQDTWDEAN